MKKLLFVALLFAVFLLTGCSNNSSFTVDQIDVRAHVFSDGDLYVEELYTYTFKGDYNNVQRNLEELGHEGVEFFEAYIPPNGLKLGEFTYEDSKWLDVDYHNSDSVYYTDINAKDETLKVYYRYRLDQAVSKFKDTGELDWNFFVFHNSDLHNITIETFFPEPFDPKDIERFAFNRNDGEFTTVKDQSIIYHSDFLSEFETLTLQFLFQQEFLTEKEIESSFLSKDERIEEAVEREQSYERRADRLDLGETLIESMNYVLIGLIILQLLPLRTIISRLRSGEIEKSELEKMNPVLLMLLYRKGNLKVKDFLAGVFSLQASGRLQTHIVQADQRFQNDPTAPNDTILFTLQGNLRELKKNWKDIRGTDVFLIKWLFKHTMKDMRRFTLSSIAGPTKRERRNKNTRKKYRLKLKSFHYSFNGWKEGVERDYYSIDRMLHPYKTMKWVLLPLISLHYLLNIYLYIADAKSWIALLLVIVFLGVGAAFVIKHYKKKRLTVFFLIVCYFVGIQVMNEEVNNAYFNSLLLSFLLVGVVPRTTLSMEAAKYRAAIGKWRRVLRRGGYPINGDSTRLQVLTNHAILLGVGKSFITRFQQKFPGELPKEVPETFTKEVVEIIEYTAQTFREIPDDTKSGSSSSGDSSSNFSWDFGFGGDSDGGSDGGGGGGD